MTVQTYWRTFYAYVPTIMLRSITVVCFSVTILRSTIPVIIYSFVVDTNHRQSSFPTTDQSGENNHKNIKNQMFSFSSVHVCNSVEVQ